MYFSNGSCHFPSNLTTNGTITFHIDSLESPKDSSEANLKPLGALYVSGSFSANSTNDELPFPDLNPYYTNCLCAALLWSTLYPPLQKKKKQGEKEATREDLIPQIQKCVIVIAHGSLLNVIVRAGSQGSLRGNESCFQNPESLAVHLKRSQHC